jgi:L-alanine-DL-glutamate epimerase-like enolase superfamily enzyme
MEFNYPRPIDYLPECLDFRDGKVLPNKRPGLGVTLKMDAIKLVSEVTEAGTGRQLYFRPDGSMTNW